MSIKTVFVRKSDKVVTNIGTIKEYQGEMPIIEDAENGSIYGIGFYTECDVFTNVEVSDTIRSQKYCYTPEKGFYSNPDYVEYKSPEQQIKELQSTIATLQSTVVSTQGAMDDLLMNILPTIQA